MKKITFVTTNKGKISSAMQYLGDLDIEVVPYNHELVEPRTDDIQEIAKQKVLQAYELVKHPCIAMDSGFYIEALNGFPRAFVNFALDTIGIDGILKLMEGKENRKCKFTECLSYYDGDNLYQFSGYDKGKLSTRVLGNDSNKKWSDLWYIYIPEGFDKTLAQMNDEERYSRKENKSEYTKSSLEEFAKWYINKNNNKNEN